MEVRTASVTVATVLPLLPCNAAEMVAVPGWLAAAKPCCPEPLLTSMMALLEVLQVTLVVRSLVLLSL